MAVAVADVDRWTIAQRVVVGTALVTGLLARWWSLGGSGLTFDEAFTGMYARVPLSQLPDALRHHDAHPPLDYVLRHPLAGFGSEWLLRAPSAVFATMALGLVVLWMRRRGWFGVVVVVLFALSPFQLLYGREARMYALMALLGVGVAMLGERWLRGDRRVLTLLGMGLLVTTACLDHAGGLFLAAGVFCLAGLRRDRDAWWLRVVPVAAVGAWAALWLPSFLVQVETSSSSWVPLTSPASVIDTAGGLVGFVEGTAWIGAVLVALGCACTWARDRALGRLIVCLFVVPLILLAVAGLQHHVLLTRTLAASSWAAPVALAALVMWCWDRRSLLAAGVAVVVAALAVRSLPRAITYDEGTSAAVSAGLLRADPGDGVFVHPAWWWPLAAWNGAGGDREGEAPPSGLTGDDGWYWQRPGAASSGTTWILHPASYPFDTARWPSCGPTEPLGDGWLLDCVVTGGS